MSEVSAQKYYIDGNTYNELFKPDFHVGWDYATDEQLAMLIDAPDLLGLFKQRNETGEIIDGSYVNAFKYWNTVFDDVIDTRDIEKDRISSQWNWSSPEGEDYDSLSDIEKEEQLIQILFTDNTFFDTFYVRTTPVPEPSTLMIFALGLITLASKKRLFS